MEKVCWIGMVKRRCLVFQGNISLHSELALPFLWLSLLIWRRNMIFIGIQESVPQVVV